MKQPEFTDFHEAETPELELDSTISFNEVEESVPIDYQ